MCYGGPEMATAIFTFNVALAVADINHPLISKEPIEFELETA